jgi:hypothetical protein
MGKGNSFEATISNKRVFSLFSQKTVSTMVLFEVFLKAVTRTCSRRNKLLFKKWYELFQEMLVPFCSWKIQETVLDILV